MTFTSVGVLGVSDQASRADPAEVEGAAGGGDRERHGVPAVGADPCVRIDGVGLELIVADRVRQGHSDSRWSRLPHDLDHPRHHHRHLFLALGAAPTALQLPSAFRACLRATMPLSAHRPVPVAADAHAGHTPVRSFDLASEDWTSVCPSKRVPPAACPRATPPPAGLPARLRADEDSRSPPAIEQPRRRAPSGPSVLGDRCGMWHGWNVSKTTTRRVRLATLL